MVPPTHNVNSTWAECVPPRSADRLAEMDSLNADIIRRAGEYAAQNALRLKSRLGFGKDGTVWSTDRLTAIKVFRTPEPFRRELDAYERLTENGVTDVLGFHIPELVQVDEDRMVIEMTLVDRPFVLDFGSAYLDGSAPEFPADIIDEWLTRTRSKFGSHWGRVVPILRALERIGITLTDVHPGNIAFAVDDVDTEARSDDDDSSS